MQQIKFQGEVQGQDFIKNRLCTNGRYIKSRFCYTSGFIL